MTQDCPCGWKGEHCAELDPILHDRSKAMDQLCNPEGFDHCVVTILQEAYCFCSCGYEGKYCDEEVVPYFYNYLCSFIAGFLFVGGMLYFLLKRDLYNHHTKDLTPEDFVEPWFPSLGSMSLLLFRIFMILVFFPVAILDGIISNPFPTFTMWNWLLFGIMFLLGSVLSICHIFEFNMSTAKGDLSFLHKTYWILFEIELVSATFIDICVWTVLLPVALLTEQPKAVLYPISYFMHALNFVFLFVEFFLNRLYLNYEHWPFLMIWGGCYYLFHTAFMLVRELEHDPHCPVYPFLNMGKHYFLICSVIIPLTSFGLFKVYCKLSRFKQRHVESMLKTSVDGREFAKLNEFA